MSWHKACSEEMKEKLQSRLQLPSWSLDAKKCANLFESAAPSPNFSPFHMFLNMENLSHLYAVR